MFSAASTCRISAAAAALAAAVEAAANALPNLLYGSPSRERVGKPILRLFL